MIDRIDKLCIDSIRILAAESVERAKSGHPGIALGAADMAYALMSEHLKFNPKNPSFFNRDRFILSAGHGSSLLYSLLHHFGYNISLEDMKNFRQLHSKTPGHPEYGVTDGVETSTGPLGQGFANAVGFALAEKMLGARFNREEMPLIDHYTYALCGDGCLMEGISYEAASLAGVWELNKLIVLYDSNNICIEGEVTSVFKDDIVKRHEAMGWHVEVVENGNNFKEVAAAIARCKAQKKKPSLIEVKTKIGFGSPLENSAKCHGAPLGKENLKQLKAKLGFGHEEFSVLEEVYAHLNKVIERGERLEKEWNKLVDAYKEKHSVEYAEFLSFLEGKVDIGAIERELNIEYGEDATRNISGNILNVVAKAMPNLVGGTADLSPSTKAYIKDGGNYSSQNPLGRNILFGVREQAMVSIVNGVYLHGGFNVFCSTFFVFSDYLKGSLRMTALMNIPCLFVLSHDSIGVGEDGATHQPLEQLASIRTVPHMSVVRPSDGAETAAAYIGWLKNKRPTALVLSRQNLPQTGLTDIEKAQRGGYVLVGGEDDKVVLIASGSEVATAIEARKILGEQGVGARVVSMPCIEIFESQSPEYKESVLPNAMRARVAVEAAHTCSLSRFVGLDGASIGVDRFGVSAPSTKLFDLYGITSQNIAATALKLLEK